MTQNSTVPNREVTHGRIGGVIYGKPVQKKPMLVVFNQWRSSSQSIFSKYLAEMILDKEGYSCVLFIDRIASGGRSDESLSGEEKARMRQDGEFLFGEAYAKAIEGIIKEHDLPKQYVLAGSSAGAPAVLATAYAFSSEERRHVLGLVMVEPAGILRHGLGKKYRGAVPHAFMKHAVAYRHRLGRGWWTPMDKEQYFSKKGKMFEYRARWFAGDPVGQALTKILADDTMPPFTVILSKTSHIHTEKVRQSLKGIAVQPHRIVETTGNHDVLCQPPSLSEFYQEALDHRR